MTCNNSFLSRACARHRLHNFSFGDHNADAHEHKILFNPYRDEAQRILSEVTDHMEQQHTAHKYLESLRLENERIVLKEKEREVRASVVTITYI